MLQPCNIVFSADGQSKTQTPRKYTHQQLMDLHVILCTMIIYFYFIALVFRLATGKNDIFRTILRVRRCLFFSPSVRLLLHRHHCCFCISELNTTLTFVPDVPRALRYSLPYVEPEVTF